MGCDLETSRAYNISKICNGFGEEFMLLLFQRDASVAAKCEDLPIMEDVLFWCSWRI